MKEEPDGQGSDSETALGPHRGKHLPVKQGSEKQRGAGPQTALSLARKHPRSKSGKLNLLSMTPGKGGDPLAFHFQDALSPAAGVQVPGVSAGAAAGEGTAARLGLSWTRRALDEAVVAPLLLKPPARRV